MTVNAQAMPIENGNELDINFYGDNLWPAIADKVADGYEAPQLWLMNPNTTRVNTTMTKWTNLLECYTVSQAIHERPPR